jgi:hypothetical protein
LSFFFVETLSHDGLRHGLFQAGLLQAGCRRRDAARSFHIAEILCADQVRAAVSAA